MFRIRLFEIKDGKITTLPDVNPGKIKSTIIATIIIISISLLSGWLKIEEKELWKLYNSIIQHFGLTENTPDIKDNEKKLESQIELEVDKAIREYEDLTKDSDPPRVPLPRLIEKAPDKALCQSEECKKLGGEIRLCAPWLDTCKEE